MRYPPDIGTDWKGKQVIIVGMHRSGTSCLAGSMEEAGLFLGEVMQTNSDNLKGNRENRRIMNLQEALLCSYRRVQGGPSASWYSPPDNEIEWAPDFEAERDRIIAGYPLDRPWGFKDPRTLFTLNGWLRALPGARIVGSFRHPMAVARSLKKRNNFELAFSLGLWQAYNRRLLEIVRTHPVTLIDFDLDADRYTAALTTICERLGLNPPPAFRFFETSLRTISAPTSVRKPASDLPLFH